MKILLVGYGKMGAAMMSGWLKGGVKKSDIKIIDPVLGKDFSSLPKSYQPDFILVAVKPQSVSEILPELKRFKGAVIISIAAGKTISSFTKELRGFTIVRTMPNLPAVIGKGITAAVANKKLKPMQKKNVDKLLQACGKVVWVRREVDIDSITAISGSGPAYVFLFAQSMIEAAVKEGLTGALARELVLETIKGSAELAMQSESPLKKLKEDVTSKRGTTEAALKVLENKNVLKKNIALAVNKAKKRAKELSS